MDNPFKTIRVNIVESGTEVEVVTPAGPETLIITDDEVVFKGGEAYTTATTWERVCSEESDWPQDMKPQRPS